MAKYLVLLVMCLCITIGIQSQSNHGNKFEQLGTILPTDNNYRNMDGSPGPDYWQQRVDYDIECSLDEKEQRLDGKELITYYNQSPSTLNYLWLQLDENEHSSESDKHKMEGSTIQDVMSEQGLRYLEPWRELDKYGDKIHSVIDDNGDSLKYTINQTMMRVELPHPLKPGEHFSFHVDWHYYLIDRIHSVSWGRGGYEYFEKDGNSLYTIVQWYPRLCAYTDEGGWQTKQFIGRGEFALTFGNFIVKMTVPEDHVVGATGECINYQQVLSPEQYNRWKLAQTAAEPLEIVTHDEAVKAEKNKPKGTKTWIYKADNVRDFAWTSSRKFIWDAMPHFNEDGKKAMCMSYYGKEAYPIYSRFSTKAVAHTLKTYSKFAIPYPYPSAISVEAANGMEYPMICFNPGRAADDGTYTAHDKYGAISTIIHEVGHTYFPMIINSDERQWAWFDEGINSFVQFLAESEWDPNYPHWSGPAELITAYMKQPKDKLEPIMTNSENIVSYFANAYVKPSCALNILRETVMGREKFDYAFKTYCQRWAFKHPTPADFFRTMEDASGVDLDWFWRGWFYGTDNVDVSLDSIKWFKVDMQNNPERKEVIDSFRPEPPVNHIARMRNVEEGIDFAVDKDPALRDFYYSYKPWETKDSLLTSKRWLYDETFTEKEKKEKYGDNNYYELFFSNKGGLVMPVIIEWTYKDGTKEIEHVPVEIWRKNENKFTKVFVKTKEVAGIVIDPYKETADTDLTNNNWPVKELPSRFEVYKKSKTEDVPNAMQRAGVKPGKT
ncbi:MAG: M1 family metallopeptidase [Saprospiraceae bacterium]|uniref:M1 family metallopeptidase n=1 Tax=Candidatus Opimibacter skivensis TaxID=2982028 RepID=A0A9D7SX55_9BACT|nr:M1 family metallopeptidase [Candidatus Opimibacter skivensis]